MLNMGNGLSTGSECYDCMRELVTLFDKLSQLQQMGLGPNPSSDAEIDTVAEDFQFRAENLVLKLADHFGVTVDNSQEPVPVE